MSLLLLLHILLLLLILLLLFILLLLLILILRLILFLLLLRLLEVSSKLDLLMRGETEANRLIDSIVPSVEKIQKSVDKVLHLLLLPPTKGSTTSSLSWMTN